MYYIVQKILTLCKMLKAYKYRIYPDNIQKEQLIKFFGCSRFIYNLGLETKVAAYTSARKNITCFDLMKQVIELRKTEATWLEEVPAQMLQISIRNLDNAYTKFFKGAGFPKFKNKNSKQSVGFPQNVRTNFQKEEIHIPKLGKVKCIYHREFTGTIKNVTLSKTVTNKYFVSILVDNQKELPAKKPVTEPTTVRYRYGYQNPGCTL